MDTMDVKAAAERWEVSEKTASVDQQQGKGKSQCPVICCRIIPALTGHT